MAINRISDGVKRWEVDYTTADRKRKRKRFSTKKEAEAFLAETLQAVRRGTYIDPKLADKTTVDVLYTEWIERIRNVGATGRRPATPKTLDNYRRAYENYIYPRWGDTVLSNVQYEAVSDWMTTLRGMNGCAAGARTRQLVGTIFGRLLGYAVKKRLLAHNPAKDALGGADYIPDAKRLKKHTYLAMPQLVAIAKEAGSYDLMVMLAGTCGLRWGEITALTVSSVTLGERPMIDVARAYSEVSGKLILGTTKGGEARQVPIPHLIASRLAAAMERKNPDERIFSSTRGAALRNSKFASTVYKPAIERASAGNDNFPRPTWHDLRHTAVSLAISAGANVKVVQRIAGHASATLTLDTYAGLFDEDLHDSAARLNMRLEGLGWS